MLATNYCDYNKLFMHVEKHSQSIYSVKNTWYLTPIRIQIFVHDIKNNENFATKFSSDWLGFVLNVISLLLVLTVYSNALNDTICNVNYISKYGPISLAPFGYRLLLLFHHFSYFAYFTQMKVSQVNISLKTLTYC